MRDVSTDDLVNNLLHSVSSTDGSVSSSATEAPASSSGPTSSSGSSNSKSSSTHATTAPTTKAPTATDAPAATTTAPPASGSDSTQSTEGDSGGGGGGNGAGLSIGIALGVLALVVATLLFLRSRKKRIRKQRDSAESPPAGATCLTVPAGRGFTQEHRELGMPEMSIELPPGEHLGFSKGFDQSFASSRSSACSNPYNQSASSDSSVFNTMGGVSPTFSSRKMASYSYQYRASSDEAIEAKPSLASARSAGSTTFRLSQLAGAQSNRGAGAPKLERVPSGRTLSGGDEYAEMVTATNAHQEVDMDAHSGDSVISADFTKSTASADFTGSNIIAVPVKAGVPDPNANKNEMEMSMGPDSEKNPRDLPVRASATIRASDISMGPDSPSEGRGKRSGSVYDTIPKLSGEKMTESTVAEEENMSASFLSEASSVMSDDQPHGAPSLGKLPLLQSMSSVSSSDYGEDLSSERSSTDSFDSANTSRRSGSLIALNLEAKDGASEIAI